MPAHTKLKERVIGQGTQSEVETIDFKKQLLQDEKESLLKKRGTPMEHENIIEFEEDSLSTKRPRLEVADDKKPSTVSIENPFAQDADLRFESSSSDEESQSGSSDSDSDDDEDFVPNDDDDSDWE